MPVRYTDDSSGPSTRAAQEQQPEESRTTVAATSSSQMSKAELVALAQARGLSTQGSKAQLLDRLSGVGS